MLTRAKKHIGEPHARFEVDPVQADRLLVRFTEASRAGDIEGLVGVLADDITLWADGGGKVPGAAMRPIQGAETVARFVVQRSRTGAAGGGRPRPTWINGQPGFVVYRDGQPIAALILEVRDDRIQNIYAIANPDKLRALPLPA